MTPQRSEKIGFAVERGISRWRDFNAARAARIPPTTSGDVIESMPRRKPAHSVDVAHVTLPMAKRAVFKPGIVRPLLRIFVWFWLCVQYFGANAVDRLRGRASIQRRAVRLRELFESAGASLAKLGQQLSLRADILPYAYCAELSKMLDQAPAFPTAQAIEIIERNVGRPLNEIFATFDPDPIGSASLACVWQARLRSGEDVAVKVRRPGIGPLLSADLRALEWLLILAEALTIIKPGQTKDLRKDLRTMLMGELNFRTEARYNEMFRLRAEKDGQGVTAPRVYFDYCSDEVLVNELVTGIWMWELMAAVDRNDQEFLARARSMGVDPGVVARRIARTTHRQLLEHMFFHADPHPANLVVLPNSRICFIDFGAVGRFSTETRNTWREMQYHLRNHDIERMVHASLNLGGRLPPIDVDDVMEAMDQIFADWVFAVTSTDAEWWERSTAQNWLRFITVAREYGIPVSLQTVQFFRATLLYDSIIVRLDKSVDPIREFKGYARRAGKEARRRVRKQVEKRLTGPTRMDYLGIEQLADIVSQFAFRLQRRVEEPILNFRHVVGKIAYSLSILMWLAYLMIFAVGIGLIANFISQRWFGREISWSDVLAAASAIGWIQIPLIIIAIVVIRRLLIRMAEPDRQPPSQN
jgi:predicted unusual protein kinase regulating ubiquinone biosynthesis (AarF/ABC1/UbiB family)